MQRHILSIVFWTLASGQCCYSQATFKILHYSETSGYDHNTRQNSLSMFQSLGTTHNFSVDDDTDGSTFDSLAFLQQYAVIIFSNTSGDNILNTVQKLNFEAYINNGGSMLGIHAASDTYRHSTANGGNTGAWDWYAETLGASVQQNPNHVSGTPVYNMNVIGNHFSTINLPDPWTKNEEYYYWENGYYNSGNITVLEVEQTTGPNGQVNSYDAVRPMSWYRLLPGGGRVFYTALGHSADNYLNDQNFIAHISDALLWTAGVVTPTLEQHGNDEVKLFIQNPSGSNFTFIVHSSWKGSYMIMLYDLHGKIVHSENVAYGMNEADKQFTLRHLREAVYLIQVKYGSNTVSRKIVCSGNL